MTKLKKQWHNNIGNKMKQKKKDKSHISVIIQDKNGLGIKMFSIAT